VPVLGRDIKDYTIRFSHLGAGAGIIISSHPLVEDSNPVFNRKRTGNGIKDESSLREYEQIWEID